MSTRQNSGHVQSRISSDFLLCVVLQADILVSELLGSFGDNELSPECLDGAQTFLKPDTGISIPQSYTSSVAPVSSSKLHQEVKAYNDVKHFETTVCACSFSCEDVYSDLIISIPLRRQGLQRFKIFEATDICGHTHFAHMYLDAQISS